MTPDAIRRLRPGHPVGHTAGSAQARSGDGSPDVHHRYRASAQTIPVSEIASESPAIPRL